MFSALFNLRSRSEELKASASIRANLWRLFSLSLCLFAVQATPTDSIEEAMQLLGAGKKVEARRMLGRIARAEPANFEAAYRLGLLALDGNDLVTAAATLERASRLEPGSSHAWVALAQTYLKLKKKKPALDAASRAASLAPDDPVTLHGLALFFSETENWSQAASYESRYADKVPGDHEAIPRAMTFYLNAGQTKEAIELAKKGLALVNRADLHNLLGKAFEADGQFDRTILELQEAIRLNPAEESYYFDLAHVLLLHQNFDVAIRVLEPAKKIFEESAQLELALGVAYYGQRRFEDAVNSFLRATTLAPDVEQPYVFLARIIDHAGSRVPEVSQKFAEYARANARNYLGPFLHAKGLIAQLGSASQSSVISHRSSVTAPSDDSSELASQAESLLRKSIALNDNYWESHFELGLLLERRRDFARAAGELQSGIRLNPKNPASHYRLARIYDRLGKPEKATAERTLHEQLTAEERAAVEKHAAGVKRLELIVR